MLELSIRFDLGRYHATPWGENVNAGAVEWPPSPWRILRSIFAVSRTNVALTDHEILDLGLAKLAKAGAPEFGLPPSTGAHTRHYMPSRVHLSGDPKTDKVIDGFRALDPEVPLRIWWPADLDDEQLAAFKSVVEALPYLGRSESVCTARVRRVEKVNGSNAVPADRSTGEAESELIDLLCPDASLEDPLEALTVSVTAMRKDKHLIPRGSRSVTYRVEAASSQRPPPSRQPAKPQLLRFRLTGGSRPSIREAVALGTHLRAACQSRYGKAHDGGSSPTLSGRSGESKRGDQHAHAHYLSTPDSEGRRVDHLIAWAPEGFDAAEIEALAGLRELRLREAAPLRVALTALGDVDDLDIPALLGPSRTWRSLTPFGLVRHPKTRGGRVVDSPEQQIRDELAARGLPAPLGGEAGVRLLKGPWMQFRRTRPGSSRQRPPRVVGAELNFPEPTRGPLAIGALSHFGLGLFEPAR